MRWKKELVDNAAIVIAALSLFFHFSLTVIYLLPVNPVKLRLVSLVDGYVGSVVFQQNWHLFAPNPLSENISLLGKCRAGEKDDAAWIDISSYSLSPNAFRFDPIAFARAQMQLTSVLQALGSDGGSFEPLLGEYCLQHAEADYCERKEKLQEESVRDAMVMLEWLVSEVCRDIGSVEQVGIGIAIERYPRFSERDKEGIGDVSFLDFGWRAAR